MLRHNKKRNTALLYEFLIRHVSKCMLEQNTKEANAAVGIIKKYFSKNSPLSKEYQLFNTVVKTHVESRESAQKVLNEVYKYSKQMNVRTLDNCKSNLVKEINHNFDYKTFYSYKIPNYMIYATIQTLMNESRNKKQLLESIEKIKLEDTLVNFLIKEDKKESGSTLSINPKYNNAVYKFVINKFKEKYSSVLSESQNKLLSKYVLYLVSDNKAVIQNSVNKEVTLIKEALTSVSDHDIKKDKELMKKISECRDLFSKNDFSEITEHNMINLLQYMGLVEELKS